MNANPLSLGRTQPPPFYIRLFENTVHRVFFSGGRGDRGNNKISSIQEDTENSNCIIIMNSNINAGSVHATILMLLKHFLRVIFVCMCTCMKYVKSRDKNLEDTRTYKVLSY